MLRVFCSTNYCGLLDAQHCRDRQAIATLEGERDAAIAQASALAADNAKLRAADGARRPRRLLQREVTRRERDIRAWRAACEEGKGVQG